MFNFLKDLRVFLCCLFYYDCVCFGVGEDLFGLFRCSDVIIGEYGDVDVFFNLGNGIVFYSFFVSVSVGLIMNCQCLYISFFSDVGDGDVVVLFRILVGVNFQGNWYFNC